MSSFTNECIDQKLGITFHTKGLNQYIGWIARLLFFCDITDYI